MLDCVKSIPDDLLRVLVAAGRDRIGHPFTPSYESEMGDNGGNCEKGRNLRRLGLA
jgi:hypothetical protein